MKYVKKFFPMLVADLTTWVTLYYLWNKGYKRCIPLASLCCLGVSYLYCCLRSRDKISSNYAVVITGCGSGLGYSLALHCQELGATVIAGVLQMSSPGSKRLLREGIFVYPLDITLAASVENFTDFVRTVLTERNSKLRCLINNAAVMVFGEFEWQTYEQLRKQMEVNLLGTMRITKELMPLIRAHFGRIIVVSSHCNTEPIPGVAAYSGTKAAVSAWATAIRVELKKYGVKVVCFVPGSFVGESNILARQSQYFKKMERAMSTEAKTFYGDYFARYSQYFSSMARCGNLDKLEDSGIFETFEGALLDKYPSAVYTNEPWRYTVYHTMFKITPTCLRDRLVERFVQAPPWTKQDVAKSSTQQ
ncbi:Estradiol 17-beta-dehydrogenase 2 [Melipona quadrifasciata]|uniref:Estradiol 17-beta-dehydrogenase 2 n=1 Tax=Melipona quadrifasciata TaxID=166423 RepID=A0A0M9A4I9_9HYME|nr:Estradiol 17-beta-dehydrogenase 2 [Melipona quadrifasciata]